MLDPNENVQSLPLKHTSWAITFVVRRIQRCGLPARTPIDCFLLLLLLEQVEGERIKKKKKRRALSVSVAFATIVSASLCHIVLFMWQRGGRANRNSKGTTLHISQKYTSLDERTDLKTAAQNKSLNYSLCKCFILNDDQRPWKQWSVTGHWEKNNTNNKTALSSFHFQVSVTHALLLNLTRVHLL